MSCDDGNDYVRAAVAQVEDLLGYSFLDSGLLEEALTHPSCPDHSSYQRLEFVGDAALGLAFTNHFYLTNPNLGPGPLSILRRANICTEKLARVAVRHGLFRFLRRNNSELDRMVEEFTLAVEKEREEDFYGSTIKAPKVLADIVESIAAAVYVDCNFNLDFLWKVFEGILEPIITSDKHPVTTLYEYSQKKGKSVEFENCKNGSTNVTNVLVDGKRIGTGSSKQKRIAKLNATKDALQNLHNSEPADMETVSSPSLATGAGEEEGSKQKLNEFCSENHLPKPAYGVFPREMAESKPGLRKPIFTKVDQLRPGTSGHTLMVKVVSSKTVLRKGRSNGPQVRQMHIAECLVGDETGMIVFTARNEQVDLMKPGTTVILQNAKIDMFKGLMRLAVDKWGRVEPTDPADFTFKEDNNLSSVEYELVNIIVE